MDKGDNGTANDFFSRALNADQEYAPPYFFAGELLLKDRAKRKDGKKFMGEYLKRAPNGPFAAEAHKLER
jgi:hypothetical protein